MSLVTRNLQQTATYWSPGTVDMFGAASYTRTTLKVRWEYKNQLITDVTGSQVVSNATVFVGTDLTTQGYLFLGESSADNPAQVEGAFPIKAFVKIPSVNGKVIERKALL